VRMEAQFALAEKDTWEFGKIAKDPKTPLLARIHAIWGCRMDKCWILAKEPLMGFFKAFQASQRELKSLFKDPIPEIRATAVQVYCDEGSINLNVDFGSLLIDKSPQVRVAAALGIAKSGWAFTGSDASPFPWSDALFRMIRDNNDEDPYVRHAGAYGLSRCFSTKDLIAKADDKSPAVRKALVVALRRQKAPEVAVFLADSDPKVVAEAARAINDELISPALPKLAALLTRPDLPRVVGYRALNAHFLLGKPENARALAEYAGRSDAPEPLRALAIRMLGDWPKPPRRDYITGLTQDLPARPKDDAGHALAGVLDRVFAGPDEVRRETVAAAKRLELSEASPHLIALVGDEKAVAQTRIDALTALASMGDSRILEATGTAVASADASVRTAGRGLLYRTDPAGVMKDFRAVLAGANVAEQQGTFALFAQLPSAAADALIEEWLDKVIANAARPELALEILEAAAASKSERIKRRLAGYENARSKDELGKYRETLAGGSARRGRDIFLHKAEVQCQRCHSLDGQGGEVGPPVNGAGKQSREYLLESIVVPNKTIAKGYETVLITTLDNKTVSGVLKGENDKEVHLMTAEGKPVTVWKADIDDRRATRSAMPDDLAPKLTKRELRDLVEFLSRLKDEWKKN
jgi:quinoprotein glucose dehydrogenase